MNTTVLNDNALQVIKDDRGLFIKIMGVLGVTERTVQNHIKGNSPELTKIDVLNTLVEHTGQPLSLLVTSPKLSKLLIK